MEFPVSKKTPKYACSVREVPSIYFRDGYTKIVECISSPDISFRVAKKIKKFLKTKTLYIYILKRSQKGQAHTNTRKLNRDISTGPAVFLNRKRVNVCEHTTKMASLESLQKVPPGGCERDGWREII